MSDSFSAAFGKTMGHEGGYANITGDPGGETFRGISRVHWPGWEGWRLVDQWRSEHLPSSWLLLHTNSLVVQFYRQNFWNRVRGDEVSAISPDISGELFDSAVNVGVHQSVKFLQRAMVVASPIEITLLDDGEFGPVTMAAFRNYISNYGDIEKNSKILLRCMNGEQYLFYKSLKNHRKFRGWFLRC